MVGTFCDFTIETKIDSKSHFTDTEKSHYGECAYKQAT